jgi:hypothetical protein
LSRPPAVTDCIDAFYSPALQYLETKK